MPEFLKFIGVKIVEAVEMTMSQAERYLGRKLTPTEGSSEVGYLVRYPDGYKSWCPKEQFEEANRLTTGMTFGHAIEAAKKGCKIARAGWNGKGIFVELMQHVDGEPSHMTHPYLFIDTTGLQTENEAAPKNRVPWLASQTDMLSDDWTVVN